MKIGAPFNPYKVFQGVFAPYWILEHGGIGSGAKLCYIRLLGFAGKDARCYPSLETLGKSLGVSDRQARDYVKELERAGLITTEQRGLRRTNVYLFLWTAELEKRSTSVPDDPDMVEGTPRGPIEPPVGGNSSSGLDRNSCSALDRNRSSAPDRNTCSGLDRKNPAGPIGINSMEMNSVESSSTSAVCRPLREERKKGPTYRELIGDEKTQEPTNRTAHVINRWAQERNLQRLRTDRQVGPAEKEHLTQWAGIFEARHVTNETEIYSILDVARAAADRHGEWRHWGFLTLQIQLAAERCERTSTPAVESAEFRTPIEEVGSLWARAKERIRLQIPETAFVNWFACTRQIRRHESRIEVAVPDTATDAWLRDDYDDVIKSALSEVGVEEIRFVVGELVDGTP